MFERNIIFSFVFVLFSCDTSRNWFALNLFYLAQVNLFKTSNAAFVFPKLKFCPVANSYFVSTARDDYKDKIEVKASHHMYNAFDNF